MATLAEEFVDIYTAWVQAGGDPEEAFRFYMLATGRIAVSQADYEMACEKLKSHVEEVKQMGLRLPK